MNGYDLIRSPTWEVSMPSDWKQVDKENSSELYFESYDGTKSLYIATWSIRETPQDNSKSVAHSFRRVEQSSLKKMAGYSWELLLDETTYVGQTCVAHSDAWAKAQSYRITSKIIATLPIVVRATFHDYQCENLEASQLYFNPIIHSLQIHGDAV